MDPQLWISLLLILWLGGIGAAALLLARANAQIKRHRDAPTPKRAFRDLVEDYEAQDTAIGKLKRDVASLEDSVEKLHANHRSLQNQIAAQKRRDNQIDPSALADYIQAIQASDGEEPEPPGPAPGAVARPGPVLDRNGDAIDFR